MYRYISVSEELSSPYLGRYRSFGIAAQREAAGHWQEVCKVSDVSTDPVFVENLAARCTAGQLEPVHLMDIIEDALILECRQPVPYRFGKALRALYMFSLFYPGVRVHFPCTF